MERVEIANTVRITFRSTVNARRYSISIALPLIGSNAEGCPVLYVLDGDWYFASATEAVRANAAGVAVVGIGYPADPGHIERVLQRHRPLPKWAQEEPPFRAAVRFERTFDLSLPATEEVLVTDFQRESTIREKDVGGLEAFLRVLEDEIKPRVAGAIRFDPSKQAIFGHSLGGLAVLHALFMAPRAFRTFVAASPSIWWNRDAVLGGEGRFADAIRTGATPRVLITMGSDEQTADRRIAAMFGLEFTAYAERVHRHRMVDKARELTERLRSLNGSTGFEVEEYAIFPRQGHGASAWPALGRAVTFAFPP